MTPCGRKKLCSAHTLCVVNKSIWCAGNVATEDVVYMLNGLGIKHGVDMDKLLDVSEQISVALGRPNSSRAAKALLAARTDIKQKEA